MEGGRQNEVKPWVMREPVTGFVGATLPRQKPKKKVRETQRCEDMEQLRDRGATCDELDSLRARRMLPQMPQVAVAAMCLN